MTERIYFDEVVTTPDGAGGTTGTQTQVYACLAEWEAIKADRRLEAAQVSLRQGYRFKIWVTVLFEPKPGSTIRFLDERLTIQDFRYFDQSRSRYLITAVEGSVNG